MECRHILILTLALLLGFPVLPMEPGGVSLPVQKIESFQDLYRQGDVYIAGQPSIEMLCWLKNQGVNLVINLRTETENKSFTATGFDEAALARELGLIYVSLPMGTKEPGTSKTVDVFAHHLRAARGKALLHCASAGRATHLWMAYLVRHEHMSLDEAAAMGRKMRFSMPLEELLGEPITMRLTPTKP